MSHRITILAGKNRTTTPATVPPPPKPTNVDSDFIVILAAFICALICVLGLIAVARCTWLRRLSGVIITGGRTDQPPSAAANKGLKKKVLKTLPKLTYSSETVVTMVSDCAICLTEFSSGDEIRVLPQCGHGFHVTCIDTWFGFHSSCPSCRMVLVAGPRCEECGEVRVGGLDGTRVVGGETSGSVDGLVV